MYGNLKRATWKLLEDVVSQTGVEIQIAPRAMGYQSQTELSSFLARGGAGEVTIAYDPAARSIDYAVAHEALRLKRFLRAHEPMLLISTPSTRSLALSEMQATGYAGSLHWSSLFYDGMLTQLVSAPADPWINVALFEDAPALRDDLFVGVAEVGEQMRGVLRKEIEEVTPPMVYKASNAINAQFASLVGELLGKAELPKMYEGTAFAELGRELRTLNASDRGHLGDCSTTDEWARVLGLVGWYEWRRV